MIRLREMDALWNGKRTLVDRNIAVEWTDTFLGRSEERDMWNKWIKTSGS